MAGSDINSQAKAFYEGQNNSYQRPASLLNGDAYFVEVLTASVAAASHAETYITTGDNAVYIEFIRTRMDGNDYVFSIYEGATVTASTDSTPANMSRVSTETPTFTAGLVTTASAQGTLLFTITHVENSNQSTPEASESNFMLLAPNTTYIMRYAVPTGSMAAVFALDYVFVERQ